MIYSCSWPDYERSSSIAVNFSLVAEHCNSWRIFWDVREYDNVHLLAEGVGWTHTDGCYNAQRQGSTRTPRRSGTTAPMV
eukprot:COSAG02_NODE_614_length_19515_cov_6.651937_17_plen_80_part_00